MIITQLKIDKSVRNTGKVCGNQRVELKCDSCYKEYSSTYSNVILNREKPEYKDKDLCRSCKQQERYRLGLKTSKGWDWYNKKENLLEKLGTQEKVDTYLEKCSERFSGKNNPNYGAKYSHGFREIYLCTKNKTFEELYGKERAINLKSIMSIRVLGDKNPMYGKPSPIGSGNGWSGWYKEWYFRSLLELSYMINVIEKNNLEWVSGEKKQFKIPYLLDGKEKTYHCDFIIDNTFIEIKPKRLINSKLVKIKREAAECWCTENGFMYKMVSGSDFEKLSNEQIKELHDDKIIKFIDRYEEKYKEKFNGNTL